MGRSRSYSKSYSRQSQSLLKENRAVTQDYIVECIKVAEVELMRGHRIVEGSQGTTSMDRDTSRTNRPPLSEFHGKQVDCMSNASIATKESLSY